MDKVRDIRKKYVVTQTEAERIAENRKILLQFPELWQISNRWLMTTAQFKIWSAAGLAEQKLLEFLLAWPDKNLVHEFEVWEYFDTGKYQFVRRVLMPEEHLLPRRREDRRWILAVDTTASHNERRIITVYGRNTNVQVVNIYRSKVDPSLNSVVEEAGRLGSVAARITFGHPAKLSSKGAP